MPEAQQAYGSRDAVYTASEPNYATVELAYAATWAPHAEVGAPSPGPGTPYADPDAPYAAPAAPYGTAEPASADAGAVYADADAGTVGVPASHPMAWPDSGYIGTAAPDGMADAAYGHAQADYGSTDMDYARADAGYAPPDMAYGPADDFYGPADAAYSGSAADYGPPDSGHGTPAGRFAGVDGNCGATNGHYDQSGAAYPSDPYDGYPPQDPGYQDTGAGYGAADAHSAPAQAEDWDRYDQVAPSAEPEPMPLEVDLPARPALPVTRGDERTASLVNQGRTSAAERQVGRSLKIAAIVLLAAGLLVGLVMMLLPGPGPTWPAGVAKVQGEMAKACQNPDVASEPGQVNFACAKSTRQILWVFSLLTSGDNPNFADAKNGRVGLEPITPRQGGIVAWSLNLHHPYQPTDPIDSLQVAARAINNIIGGATVTGTYGNPVVQAGLESSPANCLRYTGSSKVNAHKGFPGLCARPISSVAGQAALVADVYQKWIVGADPKAAQNAATLYENARNPGSPEVQAILKHLPNSGR